MRTILLLSGILLGILFPFGHSFVFLIRYNLMIMLFLAFIDIEIHRNMWSKKHFIILALNIIFPVFLFLILRYFNTSLAVAAFVTALAPTAVAAPAVTDMLKGRVNFVTVSVLLTNIVIALLTPFLLPLILSNGNAVSLGAALSPVLSLLFIPLLAALFVQKFVKPVFRQVVKLKWISFYLFVLNVYLASSNATYFISTDLSSPVNLVIQIAMLSMIICLTNFTAGRYIGGKKLAQEASQALGQKNNSFSIWVALTFMDPLTALGPIFYILFHNLYITFQTYTMKKEINN